MKILSLELVEFKRLALNNIRHFKIDLVSVVQLFLGTNGSGKSSILEELTPLPGNKDSFRKGGKKVIVISHNQKTYTLTSDFSHGQKHSFLVDGEEKNDGGTVTIQKELVRTHFNVTQEIHELILGVPGQVFTTMNPAKRREWFTKLCTVDYTYAIKLYRKVQENLNVTTGALKHAKKRLTTEMAKALGAEEAQRIRARISDLTRETQQLYLIREVETQSVSDVERKAQSISQQIEKLCADFHSIRKVLREQCYILPEELQSDIDDKQAEINSIKGTYNELSTEYMALSSETEQGEEMDSVELERLRNSIASSRQRAQELLNSRSIGIEGLRAYLARDAMASVYVPLCDSIAVLKANEEGKYNSERMTQLEDLVRQQEAAIGINERQLNQCMHDIRHMESLRDGETLECPSCKHSWIKGFSQVLYDNLKAKVANGNAHIASLKKKLEAEREELLEQAEYKRNYDMVVSILRSCPELNPAWSEMMGAGYLRNSPSQAVSFIDRVRNDIELMCSAEDLLQTSAQDEGRLRLAEFAQSENYKAKKARMKHLEERLGQLAGSITAKQASCDDTALLIRRIDTMYDLADKVREASNSMEGLQKEAVRAVKNEVIDEALYQVQEELAMLSVRINAVNAHEQLIADITAQIDELTASESAWKLLQKTLSPVDGLIAEGMLGFIRQYVARMNLLISDVWTYSMEVQDCSLDDESAELNYKFPVLLPESADLDPIPDVGRTSMGQQEIINLAFRISAMQCQGLDSGPLFLDEFGKTFDEAHREAATRMVARLVEQMNFSQLFMVSHYENSWGAFYKAQLTVFDKRNITLSNAVKYNEFTTIA